MATLPNLKTLRHRMSGLAFILVGTFVAAIVLLYRSEGVPAARAVATAPDQGTSVTAADVIAKLEKELKRHPEQANAWRLLGRAYASRQQPGKSNAAYAHAAKLAPNQPDVLVEAAEASALAQPKHRFDAEATAMLEHAVQLQPQHFGARWFLGLARRQAHHPAQAAETWQPLLALADAKTARLLRVQIDAVRKEAGLPPLPATASGGPVNAVKVKVQLDPKLAALVRLRGDAMVYLIARGPDGASTPVALEKHGVPELPFTATLDDNDSPVSTKKLSALREVELIARLSTTGSPTAQPGDLESAPYRVRLPVTEPVTLTILTVHQ